MKEMSQLMRSALQKAVDAGYVQDVHTIRDFGDSRRRGITHTTANALIKRGYLERLDMSMWRITETGRAAIGLPAATEDDDLVTVAKVYFQGYGGAVVICKDHESLASTIELTIPRMDDGSIEPDFIGVITIICEPMPRRETEGLEEFDGGW